MQAHGRKIEKESDALIQARQKKEEEIAKQFTDLNDQFIHSRSLILSTKSHDEIKSGLAITNRLVTLSLDFYTLSGITVELSSYYPFQIRIRSTNFSSESEKQEFYKTELDFTQKCLSLHPKSYWVWTHRMWILETMPEPTWNGEIALLNMMLKLDPRNFHGWDYRRYIVAKSKVKTAREEFDYTTEKILKSFSNHSAWHLRSKIMYAAFPDLEEREKVMKSGILMVFLFSRFGTCEKGDLHGS
jgi:geranylgeranyl transferase type-2 subunit alpha